jgi:hypothetical protein
MKQGVEIIKVNNVYFVIVDGVVFAQFITLKAAKQYAEKI